MALTNLPIELRTLVHDVTLLWGEVIREEAGLTTYNHVESLRKFLKQFRSKTPLNINIRRTRELQQRMARLKPAELEAVTHSFSVLLELINLCENSSRSTKIRRRDETPRSADDKNKRLDGEIYLVLTAHPTESRAPQIVEILNEVQKILATPTTWHLREKLKPVLRRLWYLRMARREQPRVEDEAEYIYSILFRRENLEALLSADNDRVYVRTWVGGDKDGHPGVDEKVMVRSLQLSRDHLHAALCRFTTDLQHELSSFAALSKSDLRQAAKLADKRLSKLSEGFRTIAKISDGDLRRVRQIRARFKSFETGLPVSLRRSLISLSRIHMLLRKFPSLVVPLELRESSDVFREGTAPKPAIFRMLQTLRRLSGSSDPRGYARGMIISMTEKLSDLEAAELFLKKALGRNYVLPLIPLFERGADLVSGPSIVESWLKSRRLKKFEVMLGYSDSAKEGGVLPSRVAIRDALLNLERIQKKHPGLRFTYFHGSGGSVARGGGSLEEQTAHWPQAAFDRYKVTLQGEMIQRTFSTPEIFDQYLEKVRRLGAARHGASKIKTDPALERLDAEISRFYRGSVSDPAFLRMVEEASAYRFLEELRFGSRPSKRKKLEGVNSLRAIPWILAWTQTRNLLPTWWGFGTAFEQIPAKDKTVLRRLARGGDPLFASYLHQMGFTFAKIEPAIWWMYLEQSKLTSTEKKRWFQEFQRELKLAKDAFCDLSGQRENLWKKPWLEESIRLRAPLIHPLNVAQLMAWKSGNASLVREASVGIACGMLTTG